MQGKENTENTKSKWPWELLAVGSTLVLGGCGAMAYGMLQVMYGSGSYAWLALLGFAGLGAGEAFLEKGMKGIEKGRKATSTRNNPSENTRTQGRERTNTREQENGDKLVAKMKELDKAGAEWVEMREGAVALSKKLHWPLMKGNVKYLHDKESIARGKKLKELIGNKR